METILFFAGVPLLFGVLQFLVTRSKLSRRKKWLPTLLVGLCALVCFGGMTGVLPLPQTCFFDDGGFIAFPDFWYVGLFCGPALFGLGMGALFAVADWPES